MIAGEKKFSPLSMSEAWFDVSMRLDLVRLAEPECSHLTPVDIARTFEVSR